jgi:hypothetical protein
VGSGSTREFFGFDPAEDTRNDSVRGTDAPHAPVDKFHDISLTLVPDPARRTLFRMPEKRCHLFRIEAVIDRRGDGLVKLVTIHSSTTGYPIFRSDVLITLWNKSALPRITMKRPAKKPPPPMESRPYGAEGAFHEICYLLVGQSFDVAEDNHCAELHW